MRVAIDASGSDPTIARPGKEPLVWEVTPALTVIDGPSIGDCFPIDERKRAIILGRGGSSAITVSHPTVSRHHARLYIETSPKGDKIRIVDLGSRNGTSINGYPVRDSYLSPGDKIHLGDVLLRFDLLDPRDLDFLQRMVRKARAADYDPLTGLYSRNFLTGLLRDLFDDEERRELCLLMIDLDHFKKINDTHGHSIGDEALKAAARAIMASVREADYAIRYGGEEILVVLTGTRATGALLVARRIRETLKEEIVTAPAGPVTVTASIGVVELDEDEGFASGLNRADEAVYEAKRAGRDRVVLGIGDDSGSSRES